MKRRKFLGMLGGAAAVWPLAGRAQQPAMPVIGFLQRSAPIRTDFADFRDGLKALGYEEGRNIRIEQRYARLDLDRLRSYAQELVAMNVRALVTDGWVTIQAAMAATKTIPIVSAFIPGPTQFGIATLNRPGGNLTGLSSFVDELGAKRLELLKELVPAARRIAILRDRDNVNLVSMRLIEDVAKAIDVNLRDFVAAGPDTWPGVFASMTDYRPDALLQLTNAAFASNPKEMAALAVARRLPTLYGEREFVEAGGLMSYGTSLSDQWRSAAGYVDKISQRRQGRRSTHRAADQIRSCDQSQDRESDRPRCADSDPAACHRGDRMKRRKFLGMLGGAAAVWPLAGRAQQAERMRRIGVLLPAAADDPEYQARVAAFHQGLALLGWTIGRNVRIDTRWATTDAAEIRRHAAELAALAPDVILAPAATTVGPLLQATRTVPVVFPSIVDPVGAGFVDSLARPGGNATGFMNFEYSIGGKWLELLKEIAPGVTRVAILRYAATPSGVGQFGIIQSVAPSLRVEVTPVNMRDAPEIESAVAAFVRAPNGGLIVTASPLAQRHRDLIVTLAARHKLPAVYFDRVFAAAGGLISYGPDYIDQYRRAAAYVDRILKGEKPADLPVQAPTKYELVINLKTAKALGLEVPATLLARADEVIE